MSRALSVLAGLEPQGASSSSANLSYNVDEGDTAAPVVSLGEFPANLHGFRRCFPDRWASFLRAHFQGATHVAAFFDVDHHTARAWLAGKHGANGPAVLYAVQRIPGALKELIGEAA